MSETIAAFKAFDKDLSCRGFKFEVGKTYKHKGAVKACESGFHACTEPFDVWNYYGVVDTRYAEVELSGAVDKHKDDSKIAAAEITIKAELSLPDFIRRAVERLIALTRGKGDDASGNSAQIGSSGDYAQIGSSGNSAQIGSSGNSAQIGSSGDYARIGSSGYYAKIGSSGDYAKIGSSGYSAQIGSSGDYAKIGSSGNDAQIGSSGNSAQIETTGANAVVASAGVATRAKGAAGTWVSLAEFNGDFKCIGFATGCIGQDGLKPDTWYTAKSGKLVEWREP